MLKKHRTLFITLLIGFVGMLASLFACGVYFGNYYSSREASVQINGYRIDFVYHFAMDRNLTQLKITRPDRKSAETMWKVQGNCTRLTIQHIGTKIYFLCLEDALSAKTDYLDAQTMQLYDGERDDTPTPIDSLGFH